MWSFIIPAHNEAQLLGRTLAALHAARAAFGEESELIVVNDASTDATREIAQAHGARVIDVELRNIGAVRNAGAAAARGEALVFLDADTILPAATLAAAGRAIGSGAVGGGARVVMDRALPGAGRAALALWNSVSRTARWAAGCFVFARRDAFERVGGFDARFYAAEEILLSRALARVGPFTILPHQVLTSARKLESHRLADQFAVMFRTLATGGRALQSREGLDLWYVRAPAPRGGPGRGWGG